jgi:hypothetical protein
MTLLPTICDGSTHLVGDLLRIALMAGVKHPKKIVRRDVIQSVDGWLDDIGAPPLNVSRFAQICNSVPGTSLEPMVLEMRDVEIGTRFARMAFHFGSMETGSEPGVLIGSRDAIGGGGGLLMDRNEKANFIRRFPREKRYKVSERIWGYAPEYEKACLSQKPEPQVHTVQWQTTSRNSALIVTKSCRDDLGWKSSVMRKRNTLKNSAVERYNLSDDIKRYSSVGHRGEGFGRFGLEVNLEKGALWIEPSSPEATLRFSALMAQGSTVTLDPESGPAGDRPALHILLNEPSNEATEMLAVTHSRSGALANWLRIPPLPTFPQLDNGLRKSVFEWWTSGDIH